MYNKNNLSINKMADAVVIEVSDEGCEIISCDPDFRHRLLNGNYPDDNFDNCYEIPTKYGVYQFDIEYQGGEDHYGDSTEYWYECNLKNCRKI